MTDDESRAAAKQFAADWQGRGDEKQETQTFWLALLQKVYGVAEPDKFISFEKTVTVDDTKTGKSTTKFIDGYIGATRVLIEQKGAKIDLNKGEMFHDYLQAHRAEDRRALINLFRVLDQKPENRDRYLDEDLAAFPYVNGGLFADENIAQRPDQRGVAWVKGVSVFRNRRYFLPFRKIKYSQVFL